MFCCMFLYIFLSQGVKKYGIPSSREKWHVWYMVNLCISQCGAKIQKLLLYNEHKGEFWCFLLADCTFSLLTKRKSS